LEYFGNFISSISPTKCTANEVYIWFINVSRKVYIYSIDIAGRLFSEYILVILCYSYYLRASDILFVVFFIDFILIYYYLWISVCILHDQWNVCFLFLLPVHWRHSFLFSLQHGWEQIQVELREPFTYCQKHLLTKKRVSNTAVMAAIKKNEDMTIWWSYFYPMLVVAASTMKSL